MWPLVEDLSSSVPWVATQPSHFSTGNPWQPLPRICLRGHTYSGTTCLICGFTYPSTALAREKEAALRPQAPAHATSPGSAGGSHVARCPLWGPWGRGMLRTPAPSRLDAQRRGHTEGWRDSATWRGLTENRRVVLGEHLVLGPVGEHIDEVTEIPEAVSQGPDGEVPGGERHQVPEHPLSCKTSVTIMVTPRACSSSRPRSGHGLQGHIKQQTACPTLHPSPNNS